MIAGVTAMLTRLANRLRLLRERHGLTQEEFAEASGLSYKFYQQIEAGRKKQVLLETVERLAAGFGLEVWQLLAPELPLYTAVKGKGGYFSEQERPELAVAEDGTKPAQPAPKGPSAKSSRRGKRI